MQLASPLQWHTPKSTHANDQLAYVQTSPISFVARGKGAFPRATKEIGDVCTQANDQPVIYVY